MDTKKWIAPAVIAVVLAGGAISGCVTTDGGQGVEAIEEMSELDWNKWKLYIELGVKIGANRLVMEELVTQEELNIAAQALETLRDVPVLEGATSFILPAVEDAGLTNDELMLLLLLVEQELIERGALEWFDAEGQIDLSPRTEELLTIVANALRGSTEVTTDEVEQGDALEAEFGGQIIE